MNNPAKRLLRNPWLELAARLILGATFIYASYHKILAPAEFAKVIYGYDLFPSGTINLIAVVIPFIELIAGTALIMGIYPRSAALIINTMLVFFILIISVNLIRGHEFDCGCFSVLTDRTTNSPSFMLGRNLVLLAMGIYIDGYGSGRSRLYSLVKR